MTKQVSDTVRYASVQADCRGGACDLRYFDRGGSEGPILYLHGLGCSKGDFLPMSRCPAMAPFRLLSFDFPGCGDSPYADAIRLRIDDLVELTRRFVTALTLDDFVIVGHSMGGLVALLYCEAFPNGVRAFINVEGNLAAEDCTFSRKAVSYGFASFQTTLFSELKAELAKAEGRGFARYLATLEHGASARAYHDYAFQTVAYSDSGTLLDRWLALAMPKLFIHGSQNDHLTYLPQLHNSMCGVARIAGANHFPFHDNPADFADVLATFVRSVGNPSPA